MKIVQLNIDHTTQPKLLAGTLSNHNLRHGDKLSVATWLDEGMTLLIILVALAVLHQRHIDYGNKMLEDLFADKSSDEIQKEIASEYGIEVQVETKDYNEQDNWHQFSKEKLSKAYGAEEPEYDISMVKEPNPDYRK
jgi:hypothetical protein